MGAWCVGARANQNNGSGPQHATTVRRLEQVCRANCLLATQARKCCGIQDHTLVSKGKFANLSYVASPEAPQGADRHEIHDPTLLCNALDPQVQVPLITPPCPFL